MGQIYTFNIGEGYTGPQYQLDTIVARYRLEVGFIHGYTQAGSYTGSDYETFGWDKILFRHKPNNRKYGGQFLAHHGEFLVSLSDSGSRKTSISVYGRSSDGIEDLMATLKEFFIEPPEPIPPEEIAVPVGFWFSSSEGIEYKSRKIYGDEWYTIERNYPTAAHKDLDALIKLKDIDSSGGKLALLYGPAGTGKTSFLRSLAYEWRQWASVDCILDPEVFLSSPGYMFRVLQAEEGFNSPLTYDSDIDDNPTDFLERLSSRKEQSRSSARWRVLLLEDAGELIKEGAHGQAISRLLNMSDGIVGQGQKVLFLVTTNEPIGKLSEAVIRPGRCLARIDVSEFTASEASSWLGRPVSDTMTLADLYQSKRGTDILTKETERESSGLYL